MFIAWLKRLLGGNYYDDKPSDILFLGFVEVITNSDFLTKLKIQDSFDNRMACLAAFMFCWQDYLKNNSQENLRRDFMDLTVKLLDDSLRAEGVSDIRIGKRVKQKLQHFYAQMVAYDTLFGKHKGKPTKANLQKTITDYLQCDDDGKSLADYLMAFRTRLNKVKPDELMQENMLHNLFKA